MGGVGSAERGVDLPEADPFFESSRPGVHIVGELGGMGLIKNAMTQGLQVADRLSQYGLTAVLLCQGGECAQIVMSCRVFGLRVEYALYEEFRRLAPWPVDWIDPAPAIARR